MIYSLTFDLVTDLLAGDEMVRRHYEAALDAGDEICMCATVLHELAYAARVCGDPHRRLAALSILLSDIEVEPFTGEDAMAAASAGADYLDERWRDPPGLVAAAGQAVNRGWVIATSNAFHVYPRRGLRAVDWSRADQKISNVHDVVAELLGARLKDK